MKDTNWHSCISEQRMLEIFTQIGYKNTQGVSRHGNEMQRRNQNVYKHVL